MEEVAWKGERSPVINGVSAASESSARIRSPMEFPWLLYWISFKFVTLSGAMLIAARYESSRLRRVHLSFRGWASHRGEESLSLSLSRARSSGLENSNALFHALGTIHTWKPSPPPAPPSSRSLPPPVHPADCCFGNKFITSLERASIKRRECAGDARPLPLSLCSPPGILQHFKFLCKLIWFYAFYIVIISSGYLLAARDASRGDHFACARTTLNYYFITPS